jgi:hypothetical protein
MMVRDCETSPELARYVKGVIDVTNRLLEEQICSFIYEAE